MSESLAKSYIKLRFSKHNNKYYHTVHLKVHL